jgi:hypothetical protein
VSNKKAKAVTSLEMLPRVGIRHTWADYVELLCLFNIDREISKDVLIDRFREGRDTGETIDDETDEDPDTLKSGDTAASEESVPSDETLDTMAEDLFRHLKYREGAFGKTYPFAIDMSRRRIVLRRTTGVGRLYLFLLIASNLRYFATLTPQITRDFEVLSKLALQKLLPANGLVHLFHGAGQSGRFKGKLFTKLSVLASDLFESMTVGADDFDKNDVGDGGLDVVAWVPMNDDSPGVLLCFAQCACTDKWVKKQREPMAVQQVMTLKAQPVYLTFIPFCFRTPTGGWFYAHSVGTVLLDRLRLINLLVGLSKYKKLASLKRIGSLIKATEPLI